jgi:hypothetical protein
VALLYRSTALMADASKEVGRRDPVIGSRCPKTVGRGPAAKSRVHPRLTGIDVEVLAFVNPRTGTLKMDVEIPKPIRAKYFAFIRRGRLPDAASNAHLREVWRARMSVDVARELNVNMDMVRSVYYDKVLQNRQITGVRDYETIRDVVDAEVNKRLREVRARGEQPMAYLSRYANAVESAAMAARRFEQMEMQELMLASMAEQANAELPYHLQEVRPGQEVPKGEEGELWLAKMESEELLPLVRLPPPLLPPVDIPSGSSRTATPPPAVPRANAVAADALPLSRLGVRRRRKEKGLPVAPNPGQRARMKAKQRMERTLAKASDVALQLVTRDCCAMCAPPVRLEVVEGSVARSVHAEVLSEMSDGSEASPPPLMSMEAVALRLRDRAASIELPPSRAPTPPPPNTLSDRFGRERLELGVGVEDLVSRSITVCLGRGAMSARVCAAPLPPPTQPRDHSPARGMCAVVEEPPFVPEPSPEPQTLRDVPPLAPLPPEPALIWMDWYDDQALRIGKWVKKKWQEASAIVKFIWSAFWVGSGFLIGFLPLVAMTMLFWASWAWLTRWSKAVAQWLMRWPTEPRTPAEFAGDAAFSVAVRVGAQGVRDTAPEAEYAGSVHRTGTNTMARNPQGDGTACYVKGVKAHAHADTLYEYTTLYVRRKNLGARAARTLRWMLVLSLLFGAILPSLWYVAGEEVEEYGEPIVSQASAREYVWHVVAPIAACIALGWDAALASARGRIDDLVTELTEMGLLDPNAVDVAGLSVGTYRISNTTVRTTCLGFGDESKLGAHCRVQCDKTEHCLSPESRGATLVGWTTSMAYVLRKCLCNAHNALCHRHGTVQKKPSRDVAEVYPDFASAVKEYEDSYWLNRMLDYATWLAKWPFGKRKSIEQSVAVDEVSPQRVKAMVKREVNHKVPSKARLIQFYVNLATQALFGPQFYSAQKAMCACFRRRQMRGGIDVTFASGMNATEIGQWMEEVVNEGAIQFYERDGKNWDSSMQQCHAEFRQALYGLFDPELALFAKSCDKVKGFAVFPGGLLRYSMDYTVKSGHNDTTLGNSIVNAAIAYAAFLRMGVRASILVAGDDLLVAAYAPVDCKVATQLEAEYGITPEARVFDSYEDVTFISGMWMSDRGRIGFMPLPGRLFARLWWTVSPPSPRKLEPYRRGVARGLLPSTHSVPLVRVLLESFDSTGSAIASNKGRQYHDCHFELGTGAWRAMEKRYGITAAEIFECEEYLRSLPREPLLLKHPVLDKLMEVDLADIDTRGEGIW